MSIFDESEVVAAHQKAATNLLGKFGALGVCTDLIRKSILVAQRKEIKTGSFLIFSTLPLRIVNDAGASSVLIDCGYFIQAASLQRSIAETAMLILYFSEQPDKIDEWTKASGDRYKLFGRSALKKNLANKFPEKFEWLNTRFDFFSEFGGHPSAESIRAHYDGKQFHIGPHENIELYQDSYIDLACNVWHATDICGMLWSTLYDEKIEDIFPNEVKTFQTAWSAIASNQKSRI